MYKINIKMFLFIIGLVFAIFMFSGVVSAADTVAPTVSSTDPANNAVQVPGDKQIKVVFSEPVKTGTAGLSLKTAQEQFYLQLNLLAPEF